MNELTLYDKRAFKHQNKLVLTQKSMSEWLNKLEKML